VARCWHHAPALVVYQAPGERISFGDIFESEYLIDIHVGREARALGGGPMPRKAAEKIAKHNNFDLTDAGAMIPVYTPAMAQHPNDFAVLGRGSNMKLDAPNRAILITDSCAADTALVVDREGRRKRGRLQFAPVVPAEEGDVARLTDQPVFGRFPLESCEVFEHGAVAELRYCFMVDVRDVNDADRILALDAEAAEELEVGCAASGLRRGPLVTERNVEELERLIADEGDPSKLEGLAEMLGEVLNIAWRIEGVVDAAAESLTPEKRDRLAADLRELGEAARLAHERLLRAKPIEE